VKKLALFISIFLMAMPVYAGVTYDGTAGRVIGTRAQHATSGVTMGAGDLLVADDSTFIGDVTISGQLTQSGFSRSTEYKWFGVTASSDTTITSTGAVVNIYNKLNDITMLTTPTQLPVISTSPVANSGISDYTRILVFCSSNSWTVYDNDTKSGSLLELTEGTSLTLAMNDSVYLKMVNGKWYQDSIVQHVTGAINTIGNVAIGGTLSNTGLQTATGGITVPSGATFTLASGSVLVSTGMIQITGAEGFTVDNSVKAGNFTSTGPLVCVGITNTGATATVGQANTGYTKLSYTLVTDSVTLTAASTEVQVSSKTTAMAFTLPTAAGNTGLKFTFIKASIAAIAVTITPVSGQLINSVAGDNADMDAMNDRITIMSDGVQWRILERYIQ
jgi:hypothetical protein